MKDRYIEIIQLTEERLVKLGKQLEELEGDINYDELVRSIASDFIDNILHYFQNWDSITNNIYSVDQIYLLQASNSLEWVGSGGLNILLWNSDIISASQSFISFIRNTLKLISIDSVISISINHNSNEEEISIDINDDKDIQTLKKIYKLMKDEAMKNNEHRDELEKEIVKLKEKFEELSDETKKISKEQFQNDIQGIFDSLMGMAGPLGNAIMAIYKSSKTGVKYLRSKNKIELDK